MSLAENMESARPRPYLCHCHMAIAAAVAATTATAASIDTTSPYNDGVPNELKFIAFFTPSHCI